MFRKLCTFYKPARASQNHPTISTVFTLKFHFPICNYWMEQSWYAIQNLIWFKSILEFIRPSLSSTYNCFNNKRIKHITRLRLGLSHLRDHKFKHGFLDSLKPICSCGLDVETTCHYLLHCPNFTNERSILLNVATLLLLNFPLMVTNP